MYLNECIKYFVPQGKPKECYINIILILLLSIYFIPVSKRFLHNYYFTLEQKTK